MIPPILDVVWRVNEDVYELAVEIELSRQLRPRGVIWQSAELNNPRRVDLVVVTTYANDSETKLIAGEVQHSPQLVTKVLTGLCLHRIEHEHDLEMACARKAQCINH